MAAVKHDNLGAWLKKTGAQSLPQLFLIHGESYLVKKAFKFLGGAISGKKNGQFDADILEGGSVTMGDIIEEISTFSFLAEKKIVCVKNIPLFSAGSSPGEIKFTTGDHTLLADFIQGGLPEHHYLLMTCSGIDKRKKIYKVIAEHGQVIDCAVASGTRKADLDDQKQVLKNMSGTILGQAEKSIAPQAFEVLFDRTGFNPELFSRNLDKLIAYSGKNREITTADVNAVVVRDKKDPIFHLTNAMMDKKPGDVMFYLDSLLSDGFHPLQILKSFENQIRKLLLVKCAVLEIGQHASLGIKQMGFNGFKQRVLPRITSRDERTKAETAVVESFETPKSGKAKKNGLADLLLAPNPKNAYPVFQVFLKSENFSLAELNQALIFLSDLDYRLKSSAVDARTQIENFLIHLCSKEGFTYDETKHKNSRHHF